MKSLSFPRCPSSFLIPLLPLLLAATPLRAQLILQEYARTDERATPANGSFSSFDFGPQAGAPGAPVFLANVRNGSASQRGVFSGLTLIAKATNGTAAEPTLGTNGIFGGMSQLIGNSNGAVAFAGTTGNNAALGYWTNASGSLQLIAQNGGTAPGTNLTFLLRGDLHKLAAFNSAGQVAFRAYLNGAAGGNNQGLWMGGAGALTLVARDGEQAAGFPPGTLYGTVGLGVVLNSSGNVAFYGTAYVPNQGGPSAIWAGRPGALQVVAKTGTPGPDVSDNSVLSYIGGDEFGFNDAGEVAFVGALTAANGLSSTNVIYAGTAGSLRLIARAKSQAPGLETGATFTGFEAPAINASGEVFFYGSYNSPTTPAGRGLWVGRAGQLRLVAKQGDVAPETGGAHFAGFELRPLMLSDSGRVVFRASLDSSSATGTGYFVTDKTGAVRLIVRFGDSLKGSPPVTAVEVEPAALPRPHGNGEGLPVSIGANGELVFSARWQNPGNGFDGRQAIFLARFKEDIPPLKLWGAGRDLLANEKPDRASEANAVNETVPEWSYGYRSVAASTNLTLFPPEAHANNASGVEGWSASAQCLVNTKTEPVVFNSGFGNYKPLYPAQLYLHPSANNDFIVVRWTAPADGAYRFVAKWLDLDNHGGNGGTAHLVVNGKEEFQQTFESTSVKSGKARLRARTFEDIKAGDRFDFVLGSNGDFTFDGTAFNAVVVRVPKVTITSPATGTTFTGPQIVAIPVDVENLEPVQSVALQVDGETVARTSTPPYGFLWPLETGTHSLVAVVTTQRKLKATSAEVKVTVNKEGSGEAAAARQKSEGSTSPDGEAAAATSGGTTYYCVENNGFWTNSNTWSPRGVPRSKDNVVIGRGFTVLVHKAHAVEGIELVGRIEVAPTHEDFVGLTVLGTMSITTGEIRGPLTLVIARPNGKFYVGAGSAILTDVELLSDGVISVAGGLLTERSSLKTTGQLILAPPAGSELVAKVQFNTVVQDGGKTSVGPGSQLVFNSMIGNNGSNIIGDAGSTFISENGGALVGNDGASLIGNDGSTLVGNDGASLIGLDGGTLVGLDGGSLIGNDGGTFVAPGSDNSVALQELALNDPAQAVAATAPGVILNGGTISGNGEIRANVVNKGGFILPGNSAGALLINGNYTQEAAATLVLEIGGTKTSPLQYDIFQTTGTASLGGKLIVKTINGYTPASGDTVSPLLYGSKTGSFASVSSNAQITFGASGAQVSVSGPNPPGARALNISTRLQIQSGDNVLFAGFIITGPSGSTKKVLIRGLGPSLAQLGVPGTIPDPLLELHSSGATVTNDNWQQAPNANEIPSGFIPSDSRESIIIATLPPGNYSAILKGAHGETGVGLAEVYDLDSASSAQLANISTRGFVQTGDNVLIGGFILAGNEPAKVVVLADGASLADVGLQNVLADPELELHDANGSAIGNDNWRATQEAELLAANLTPRNDKEPAVLALLTPGNYTAIVRGKNNTTGIAVVEVYNLQ